MNANEKKAYEEPTVTMVEFDFSDRIAASPCDASDMLFDANLNDCIMA